jgi:hypothetical protein
VRYAKMAAKVGRPEVDWDWVRTFVEGTIPIIPVSDDDDSSGPRAGASIVKAAPAEAAQRTPSDDDVTEPGENKS